MPAAAFLAAHSQLLCRGLQTYSAPWRVVELYPRLSAGTAAGSVHCSATSRRSPVKLTAEELSAELDPSDLETEANLVFEAEAHTQAYQAAVQQLFADVQEQQQEAAGELSQPGRPPALRADDPDAQQHLQEAQQYLSTVLAKGDVQDRDAVCSRVLQRSFRWRSRGNARLSCLEAPEVASIRERVQFLRQLGLSWAGVGSALERVPFLLGFSTDQMARVTMFLAGLGLSREDIAYVVDIEPRILGFSVKGSLIPAVGCFRRLGITNADLIKLLAKLPSVFGLSTERSLEPKVHFYLSLGIQKAELPRIFLLCPQLLSVRLDRMQTKLDCLASYDVSKKTITRLLTRFPAVFSWNEQRIVSTLNFLLSLGVPRPSLDKIIYRHPHIFRSKVETVLQPAVAWFAGHGVPLSKLVPVISKHPAMLCFQVEGKLSESVAYLKDLGFSETEISRTLLVFPQLLGLSLERNVKPTVAYLRGQGLSDKDLLKVLARMPQLMGLRTESMQRRVDFLHTTMRQPVSDIVKFPPYLACSLDKRIRPRFLFAEQSGRRWSLSSLLAASDATFCARLNRTPAEYEAFKLQLLLQQAPSLPPPVLQLQQSPRLQQEYAVM